MASAELQAVVGAYVAARAQAPAEQRGPKTSRRTFEEPAAPGANA